MTDALDFQRETALGVNGVADADVATCKCGSQEWAVYVIVHYQSLHLQCLRCEASYCADGRCTMNVEHRG